MINFRTAIAVAGALLTLQACSSSSGGENNGGYNGGNAQNPQNSHGGLPARAQRIAASGDASAIHVVRTITKPFEGCDRPNTYGWTTATGHRLAADELAWFVNHMPTDPSCPVYLYLFHDASQTHRSGFNAGAVIYDDRLLTVNVGSPIDGPLHEFKT